MFQHNHLKNCTMDVVPELNDHLIGMNRILSSGFVLNRISGITKSKFNIKDTEFINFASGSYLGLNSDIKLIDFINLKKWGMRSPFSRISGSETHMVELEELLAKKLKFKEVLTAQSISLINLNVFITLKKYFTKFIVDSETHSTLKNGLSAAKIKSFSFKNNDLKGLKEILINDPGDRKLIVLDGVYSMSGKTADLKEIYTLAIEHNAYLLIDDAHGFGVLGENGLGVLEEYNLLGRERIIYIGGFSKAFSNPLGFIAIPEELQNLFKISFNATIFSGPPCNINYIVSLRHLKNQKRLNSKRKLLNNKILFTHKMLKKIGVKLSGNEVTPIIGIRIVNESFEELTKLLYNEGIYIKPAISPIVKHGEEIIRVTLTVDHTYIELRKLFKFIEENKRFFINE